MRKLTISALGAIAALTLTAFGAPAAPPDSAATVVRATAEPKNVLVELFTSEGCSSCPPADVVLAKLVREQSVGGAKVIALGEHVDYWNSLGWRDPFSGPYYTRRQDLYSRSTSHSDQIYTPQMIVQGAAEFVGSDEAQARTEIGNAVRGATPFVPLTLTVHSPQPDELDIRVNMPATPGLAKDYWIYYAVTQDGLTSQVVRGENAGRKLNHAAVVRQMDKFVAVNPAISAEASKLIALQPGETLANLHVVAFVQRLSTRAIVAAVQVDLKGLSASATQVSRR